MTRFSLAVVALTVFGLAGGAADVSAAAFSPGAVRAANDVVTVRTEPQSGYRRTIGHGNYRQYHGMRHRRDHDARYQLQPMNRHQRR